VLRWLPARHALGIATAASLVLVVADDDLGPLGIFVGVAIVTGCLFALLEGERAGDTVSIRAVALAGTVVLVAAVVVAPHDSRDLWSYAMYGRILSVHHASPWVATPARFPGDLYLGRVAKGWRHTTSIYGPAFEVLAASITKLAGDAATLVRMAFTTTFAAATALAAWLVYRRTGRAAATALVLLHPAIALGTLAGGHNDVLVGIGLLGAVVLVLDDRPVLAGLAAGAATLVKLTGGIGIVALACWTLVHRSGRSATRFAATALGLVGLAYLPLGTSGLSAFVHNRGSLSRASAWELPRLLTGLDHRHTPIRLGLPNSDTQLLVTVGALATAALTVGLAVRLRRFDHPAVAMVGAIGTYLVVAPYVLPWYPAWIIPALALVVDRPVARLLALQASLLVVVYELKTQALPAPAANAVWWIAVLASVAFAAAFAWTLRRAGSVDTPRLAEPLLTRPAG
jgi:alpha-1,6-mannosyltransferase